jgi:hypothetical protein
MVSEIGSYSPRRYQPCTANPTVNSTGPRMPATAPITESQVQTALSCVDVNDGRVSGASRQTRT